MPFTKPKHFFAKIPIEDNDNKELNEDCSEPSWKDLNERQSVKTINIENNTIFVIAPKNHQDIIVPLFCPLCDLPMIKKEDVAEYKLHKLCSKCSYKWAGKDLSKIKDTEEFEEYLVTRNELEKPQLNLK